MLPQVVMLIFWWKTDRKQQLNVFNDEVENIEGEIREWLKAIFENGNVLR